MTKRYKPLRALTPEQAKASAERADALYLSLSKRQEIPFANEQQFQSSLMEYIDRKYAAVAVLAFHVPLELLRRDEYSAGLFHRLGARGGVADLIWLLPRGVYHGLVLELKLPKRRPTESQLAFLEAARACGHASCWTDSFDTAAYLIDAYVALPARAQIAELMPHSVEKTHEHRRRRKARQADRPDSSAIEPARDARATDNGTAAGGRSG
jgi:hypothetical protein